jgi:DNA-directed RNA polymerase specialized sigma24 family protein
VIPVSDTPPARSAGDNPLRYRDAVTTHTEAALAAIAGMETAQASLDEYLDARDIAIAKMHTEDGMSAPEIARTLGKSKSLVHRVIRTARRANHLSRRAQP